MALSRVKIRMWRMSRPEKGPGMFVWFDPTREELRIYEMEPPKDSGVEDFSDGDDQDSLADAPESSKHQFPQGELSF